MKTACILMAAGAGKRFGANKLHSAFNGKPLYVYALDAIPETLFHKVVVVSGDGEILDAARRRGFETLVNDRPQEGVSRTIELGLSRCDDCDAAMFMVADQPRLKKESVAALVREFLAHPAHIVAMGNGERRGNPAIFPKEFFDALLALTGDRGGSDVIRANESALRLHQISDPAELFDADTREQLEALE